MVDTIRWQILLGALDGWMNRQQPGVIEHLREETVRKGAPEPPQIVSSVGEWASWCDDSPASQPNA